MIKKIIIQDFFSFKGINEIELNQGINILLGINGSGKTSFLNAFRLLYEGVSGIGFQKLFIEQWGGFREVVNANQKQAPLIQLTYVFDHEALKKINPSSPFDADVYYCISISPAGTTSYTIRESIYSGNKEKTGEQFTYLDFENGIGKLSIRQKNGNITFESYRDGDISGQELVLRQITDPQRYLPTHTIKKAVDSMSIYSNFNTNSDSPLRKPTNEFAGLTKLIKTGDNLTSLLNYLKNNRTLIYDKIEKNLSQINPVYKSIEFSLLGSQIYLSLKEKNLDRTIGALHLSDGTLRYLLLMSIFCNPNKGCFVGIDEPESGLHPDMIKSVCDMMKEATDSQMIMATHSPLLLNHFELEDVLVFEKNEQNETKVKQLSEDDFPDWEGDFLVGQMWLRGQIGGTRW
ncbi:chromosome segregation protein SMC [Bacteroidia bacterium]|nr:chromosome segregation protein SMC [Bacteroidia bacterium]